MDKYLEIKNEFNALSEMLSEALDRKESVEEWGLYYTASILRVWGANILYSSDYTSLLNCIFDADYSIEHVITAMGCCGDEERKLIVPEFFKQIVDHDLMNSSDYSSVVIKLLSNILVNSALINGDFTIGESNRVMEIIDALISYAKSNGITVKRDIVHKAETTSLKEESYLQNNALAEAVKINLMKAKTKDESIFKRVPSNSEEGAKSNISNNGDVGNLDGSITIKLELDYPDDLDRGNGVDSFEEDFDEVDSKLNASNADDSESVESLLEELNSLVGLENVKKDVSSLINFIKVAKLREQRGMTVPTISYHLVFTGNPGTGKTTIARLVARLYYHMGLLQKGQLIEADRSSLVAGYLGQTALKTKKIIQKALGGVLFIDEAYSLVNRDDDMYGQEAIETLLKSMEDHRDELVVIVAGYTELMHKFVDSNPGLSSRFNKYFDFPDYTGEELISIFDLFCKKNGYIIEDNARKRLLSKFEQMFLERDEHFGNARTARNIFEKAINAQANRVSQLKNVSDNDLMLITYDDIFSAIGGENC